MQTIELAKGWNWISFNLDLQPATAPIVKVLSAKEPWTEGDIIKNPATQHFVTYSEINDAFIGDFSYLRFIYTYMVYSGHANTMCVNGNHLPADSMHITVRGDGSWSALPCLLNVTTPLSEAPWMVTRRHGVLCLVSISASHRSKKHWLTTTTTLRRVI